MYKYLGTDGMLMYNLFDIICGIVLFIFNLTQYNRKKLIQSKSTKAIQNFFYKLKPDSKINFLAYSGVWIVFEILFFSYAQHMMTAFTNRAFGDMVDTGANYFGKMYHISFLLVAFCILFWVDPLKQIDLITPAYPLSLVFTKLGCYFQGCCGGFRWEKGLFNAETGFVEFPLQLVETGLALLIFIFLMFWRDKAKPGTLFPTYLILYSATRFFSEFLSNKDDVFWILKKYHILCLIGIALGVIEYLIAIKFGDKVSKYFSENTNPVRAAEQLLSAAEQSLYNMKVEYRQFKKKVFKKDTAVSHHNKNKKKKKK